MMKDIVNEVYEIFIEKNTKLKFDDFSINELIENSGMDSFQFIQFLAYLEDYYNIEFSNSELLLENFKTIEDLARVIEKHLGY